jgi:hypothetical protein
VVDVRQAGEQAVVDLVIRVDDVAVLLPGPGAPSARWADIAPEAVTIVGLPAAAVAWARTMPPRRWQLLIGEPSLERARGDSGIPFLTRREYGMVNVTFGQEGLAVRTERCAGGQDCSIDLPVPTLTALIPDPSRTTGPPPGRWDEPPEPPVQSGQTGAGR